MRMIAVRVVSFLKKNRLERMIHFVLISDEYMKDINKRDDKDQLMVTTKY